MSYNIFPFYQTFHLNLQTSFKINIRRNYLMRWREVKSMLLNNIQQNKFLQFNDTFLKDCPDISEWLVNCLLTVYYMQQIWLTNDSQKIIPVSQLKFQIFVDNSTQLHIVHSQTPFYHKVKLTDVGTWVT